MNIYLCLAVLLVSGLSSQGVPHEEWRPPAVQTYDPAHQKPVSVSAPGIEIRWEPGDMDHAASKPGKLVLKKAGNVITLQMPDEIGQVNRIVPLKGNRAIVQGMVNGSVSEIVVLDWANAQIVDTFMCYLPEISPDGERIAFLKFYPPRGHDYEPRDFVMIYDTIRSASENRPSGVQEKDRINVGRTVFPKDHQNRQGDNVGKSVEPGYRSSSKLFWSAESSDLVFAVHSGPKLSLVWFKVKNNSVKTLSVDTSDIWNVQASPSDTRPGVQECPVFVTDIVIDSSAQQVSIVSGVVGGKSETESYSYAQFK